MGKHKKPAFKRAEKEAEKSRERVREANKAARKIIDLLKKKYSVPDK